MKEFNQETNQNQSLEEQQPPRREVLRRGVKLAYIIPAVLAVTAANARAFTGSGFQIVQGPL